MEVLRGHLLSHSRGYDEGWGWMCGICSPKSLGAFGVCMGGGETRQQTTEMCAKGIPSEL